MLNLSVKTTHIITTDDLEIYADPPLTFEAVGRIGNRLHTDLVAWSRAGYPPEQAVRFVPQMFLSVTQNGTSYSLTGEADAEALRQAVGDDWLAGLVEAFWDYDYSFFQKKRRGSASLSAEPTTGNGSEPTP